MTKKTYNDALAKQAYDEAYAKESTNLEETKAQALAKERNRIQSILNAPEAKNCSQTFLAQLINQGLGVESARELMQAATPEHKSEYEFEFEDA